MGPSGLDMPTMPENCPSVNRSQDQRAVDNSTCVELRQIRAWLTNNYNPNSSNVLPPAVTMSHD